MILFETLVADRTSDREKMAKMAEQIEMLGAQPAAAKGVIFKMEKGGQNSGMEKDDKPTQLDAVMALPAGPAKSAAILALRGA
jgi:hypothetical protein